MPFLVCILGHNKIGEKREGDRVEIAYHGVITKGFTFETEMALGSIVVMAMTPYTS